MLKKVKAFKVVYGTKELLIAIAKYVKNNLIIVPVEENSGDIAYHLFFEKKVEAE